MKPLVIAHRGASAQAPENTLKAFQLAHRMRADGIELDVFLTRDQRVVVTHDRDTKKLTGVSGDVCQQTLAELKALDFGEGEKIPTLKEVFEHFAASFSVINVEIKSMGFQSTGIEEKICELIDDFSCQYKVIISSFNPLHLMRCQKLLPNVRLAYLLCRDQTIFVRNQWMIDKISPYALNIEHAMKSEPKYNGFFEREEPKWIWTVDDETDMRFWIGQGVKAIITNHPDRLRKLIDE